jgi:hypothetical protein
MVFLLLIPLIINTAHYFILKRNVQKCKYDFERELNFIIQNNNEFKNYTQT